MFVLTAESGNLKGVSHAIGETPLIIGRDLGCDITIPEPVVSRRHCAIALVNQEVRLRDLGSSNGTLVNGEPKATALLNPGDEIGIGRCVLLVSALEEKVEQETAASEENTTSSMRLGTPLFLDHLDTVDLQGKVCTASDLHCLLTASRIFSQQSTVDALLELLMAQYTELFKPSAHWLVMRSDNTEAPGFIYPQDAADSLLSNNALVQLVEGTFTTPRGVLFPERRGQENDVGIRTTMAAPIMDHEEPLGVIVLQANTPTRVYAEHDLELLQALASIAAPYLKTTLRLETLAKPNVAPGRTSNQDSPQTNNLMSLEELERHHIALTIEACDGHISNAARQLQIGRSTLYRKIAEYNLNEK